jgi:hypothetical protein
LKKNDCNEAKRSKLELEERSIALVDDDLLNEKLNQGL